MVSERPVRVLHVLGSLSVGGVETWLTQLVQRLGRTRVETHFLLHSRDDGPYTAAVRDAGCRIEVSTAFQNPLQYRHDFLRTLERLGPIDVVHSHVHHYSGLVMLLAAQAGVRRRIAHSHSDTLRGDRAAGLTRRAYLWAMKRCVWRYATLGLAASELAADALFGPGWRRDPRFSVLHCGIDLARFREPVDRERVRFDLGLAPDDLVVGHVGRFVEPKNHRFMVEVAAALVRMEPRARFLWVGDGPLMPEIRAQIERASITTRVLLPGLRMDVPALLAAMDVFLFPSLWEGMPLGLVEAQASGLPCLVSTEVAPEAFVTRGSVRTMGLREGATAWAAEIQSARRSDRWERRRDCLVQVEASTFNLEAGMSALEAMYIGR